MVCVRTRARAAIRRRRAANARSAASGAVAAIADGTLALPLPSMVRTAPAISTGDARRATDAPPCHAIHHVLVCSDDSCERAYSSILNQPRVCEEILVESAGACRESSAFVHTVCRSGGDTHGAWRRAALSRARGDGSVASGTGEQQKIKHSLNTKTETTPRPRRYSQCTAVHTKHRRRVKK